MSIQYGANGTTAFFNKASKINGLRVDKSSIYVKKMVPLTMKTEYINS